MPIISIVDTTLIKEVEMRILRMAAEMDLDSTVLTAAIADVFGITMAVYKETGQPYQKIGIDARLESFTDRARETFYRVQMDTMDHRVISNAVEQGRLRT